MVQSDIQNKEFDTKTLESANIRVEITRKPGCHVHVETHITPIAAQAAYEKAFKNVKKEISLPGFRKGKAPDEIVLKNYKSAVEREWRSIVLNNALHETLELSKIRPLSERSIRKAEMKKCSKEEGAICIFEMEVEPEVKDMDLSLFHVEKKEVAPVTEKDIEDELENVRLSRSMWDDVEGRPTEAGDYVEVDVDVIEHPAHNLFSNRLFKVDSEHMPEWLFAAIPGMNVGDSKDVTAKNVSSCQSHDPHHTHSESCGSGVEKQVRVTLKSIKKAVLPEANDQFAVECGFENMEKFKEELKKIIEKHRVETIQEEQRMSIYGQILDHYPIDVPQSLVDMEAKSRFSHIKRASDMKKGNLPMSAEQEGLLRAQINNEARGFFMCMYQLQQLAKQLNMKVTQDELMHEYTLETIYVPYNQRLIYPGMEPEEIRSRLYTKIMMRKGIDHIIASK